MTGVASNTAVNDKIVELAKVIAEEIQDVETKDDMTSEDIMDFYDIMGDLEIAIDSAIEDFNNEVEDLEDK